MVRGVLAFAAGSVALGCKPDVIYWSGSNGSIGVTIAAEQSDLCHPDCSTEAAQVSPITWFIIGHRGDGGIPEGPLGPGVYDAPPPEDGGPGVLQWEVEGVCDDVGPFPVSVSGTVTLTHVPSSPNERLEGSYQIDSSGWQYGFTAGTFSAHTCQ